MEYTKEKPKLSPNKYLIIIIIGWTGSTKLLGQLKACMNDDQGWHWKVSVKRLGSWFAKSLPKENEGKIIQKNFTKLEPSNILSFHRVNKFIFITIRLSTNYTKENEKIIDTIALLWTKRLQHVSAIQFLFYTCPI